mmetsp:Transcript_3795/g.6856  ORF Transcript_3795/g.6856 Transcript_3795/m.6856 type:complete len:300 (-) Transcript_3795:199-1098(-)
MCVVVGIGKAGRGGQLPPIRVQRKRQQLDNIMAFVVPFIHSTNTPSASCSARPSDRRKVVVDFCCGCGHQSIPLAFLFPSVSFVLIDTNDRSLDIAKNRVKRLQLTNVRFITDNIQNFHETFDIGISLHACGVATDIAIQKCVLARAVYVSIPCCVGKIVHYDSDRAERSCGDVSYPRSAEYRAAGCSLLKYLVIAKAADYGHHGFDTGGQSEYTDSSDGRSAVGGGADMGGALTAARRLAKRVIEQDRNFYARGQEYRTFMTVCHPTSCTPKNDVVIGIPAEKTHDVAVFEQWIAIRE